MDKTLHPEKRREKMNAKKAINRLQLALGRAGYAYTVNTRRQYGHGRLFILYTIYSPQGRKIQSSYRPYEIAVTMSRLYQAAQAGEDPATVTPYRGPDKPRTDASDAGGQDIPHTQRDYNGPENGPDDKPPGEGET